MFSGHASELRPASFRRDRSPLARWQQLRTKLGSWTIKFQPEASGRQQGWGSRVSQWSRAKMRREARGRLRHAAAPWPYGSLAFIIAVWLVTVPPARGVVFTV